MSLQFFFFQETQNEISKCLRNRFFFFKAMKVDGKSHFRLLFLTINVIVQEVASIFQVSWRHMITLDEENARKSSFT